MGKNIKNRWQTHSWRKKNSVITCRTVDARYKKKVYYIFRIKIIFARKKKLQKELQKKNLIQAKEGV